MRAGGRPGSDHPKMAIFAQPLETAKLATGKDFSAKTRYIDHVLAL